MQQILGMINSQFNDTMVYRQAEFVHLLAEAERRAFADRAAYLGDRDFYPVPVDSILQLDHLQKKFEDFNPDSASSSKDIFNLDYAFTKEHFETTHFSIVDQEGNAASVTTTLNDNFGCKVWVPGGGYFLNNQMDDFSIKPGTPNMFGLIGNEENAIEPGKRMLSSMTPTIIEKSGQLWMVLGSPGGPTIITSVLQVFLNVGAFDMTLEQAVKASRFHHQGLPDEIMIEKGAFSTGLQDSLKRMGHSIREIGAIGLVDAVWIENNIIHGVADHRSDDHASGW